MLGSDLLSKLSAQSGDQTMGLLHAAAERKKQNTKAGCGVSHPRHHMQKGRSMQKHLA